MATDAAIEAEIIEKGKTGPRVTPADVERNIVGEYHFTAAEGVNGAEVLGATAIDRFLAWPVPASCHPDGTLGQPGRTGTNLLSATEARAMLDHVLASDAMPAALGLLTFCVLVLRNGFTVTGESACASPENYNKELGQKIARANAIAKIWPLMGYELRTRLMQEPAKVAAPAHLPSHFQIGDKVNVRGSIAAYPVNGVQFTVSKVNYLIDGEVVDSADVTAQPQ